MWSPAPLTSTDSVATGAGQIRLLQVQPQGRRPMAIADYARGNRWAPGLLLTSIGS